VDPLKILHVTPSFHPALVYGGPTYSVYELCRNIVLKGCQVRVLTTDANGPDSVLKVNTKESVEISPGLFVRYCHRVADVSVSPTLLRLLIAQIRWADVVHLMAVYSFPTIPTLVACKVTRKPVVWSPRGMLQRWEETSRPQLKLVWEKLCQITAPRRLVLHATSEEEARESQHRLPGLDTVVVPNGIEIPKRIVAGNRDKEFQLVFLGRLHPKKGIESLLRAYRIVIRTLGMTSSLVIAGDGEKEYTETIKILIKELGLSGKVKMMGHVHGEAKEELFENASVVVVPSYTENFGLVVAEALAHGIPVIASRGTPWQRVEEVGCGLWVNNHPESLAAAIKRIALMPLLDMGLRGRRWMQKEFAWDMVAEVMIQVYRGLIRIVRGRRRDLFEFLSVLIRNRGDAKG